MLKNNYTLIGVVVVSAEVVMVVGWNCCLILLIMVSIRSVRCGVWSISGPN